MVLYKGGRAFVDAMSRFVVSVGLLLKMRRVGVGLLLKMCRVGVGLLLKMRRVSVVLLLKMRRVGQNRVYTPYIW